MVDLLKLLPEQHFTQPPPRYTEPTLIKALEANGVGRPSTYASIVTLIQDRGYVLKNEDRRLQPTALGMVVCDTLVATFEDIMDVGYTATMEERLDRIAEGELSYVGMLRGFYADFRPELESARGTMPQAIERALWAGVSDELRQRPCPQCGRPLQARLSEAGRFLGCTGYPECRYVLDLSAADNPKEPVAEFAEGEICELCGGRMKIITRGRNKFLGCENYPRCKNTRSILSDHIKQVAAETLCPQCQGPLEPKKGRFGEYLRCPRCQVNHSLSSLGLGKGKGRGQQGRGDQDSFIHATGAARNGQCGLPRMWPSFPGQARGTLWPLLSMSPVQNQYLGQKVRRAAGRRRDRGKSGCRPMNTLRIICLGLVLTAMARPVRAMQSAPPPLPCSLRGTVLMNGANVPVGTAITAGSAGVVYQTTTTTMYDGSFRLLPDCTG